MEWCRVTGRQNPATGDCCQRLTAQAPSDLQNFLELVRWQCRLCASEQASLDSLWLADSSGWKINARSLANFLMQANGAEMLRIACILMTESGIRVCAPVHDAVLIEAPLDELEERIGQAQELMREASRQVLGDFELTTDADIYRYPDRYRDEERGGAFWDKVMSLLPDPDVA